jgi:putative transposase
VNYDPDKHHRRSIRLKSYNYTWTGSYFITVVSQHRACLFGDVLEDEMILNEAGKMVVSAWSDLPARFPVASTDAFVVMPNHVHGIIVINNPKPVGAGLVPAPVPTSAPGKRAATRGRAPTRGAPTDGDRSPALGNIVGTFKSLTTRTYMEGVRHQGWQPFETRLWQRNYYERVIRNEDELDHTRAYIEQNPLNWAQDRENPVFGESVGRAEN